MSYTELYNTIKENTLIQGVSIEHLERKETLYYDETENVKHLILKNGSLNAAFNTVFVLGGIQAEDTISIESLKSRLGKQPTTELKAKKDLKGDFIAILRKDNFRQILELIQEKKMAHSFQCCANPILCFCRYCRFYRGYWNMSLGI